MFGRYKEFYYEFKFEQQIEGMSNGESHRNCKIFIWNFDCLLLTTCHSLLILPIISYKSRSVGRSPTNLASFHLPTMERSTETAHLPESGHMRSRYVNLLGNMSPVS